MTKRQRNDCKESIVDKWIDVIVDIGILGVGLVLMLYGLSNPPSCLECFNYIAVIGVIMVAWSSCYGLVMLDRSS